MFRLHGLVLLPLVLAFLPALSLQINFEKLQAQGRAATQQVTQAGIKVQIETAKFATAKGSPAELKEGDQALLRTKTEQLI